MTYIHMSCTDNTSSNQCMSTLFLSSISTDLLSPDMHATCNAVLFACMCSIRIGALICIFMYTMVCAICVDNNHLVCKLKALSVVAHYDLNTS